MEKSLEASVIQHSVMLRTVQQIVIQATLWIPTDPRASLVRAKNASSWLATIVFHDLAGLCVRSHLTSYLFFAAIKY